MDSVHEEWRAVKGFEGYYEVSSHGRVRSRLGVLAQSLGTDGYPKINLKRNGSCTIGVVHRLVAAAFIGDPQRGIQVNHKDCDKQNNHLSNLEYVTPSENTRHAYAMGRMHPASGEASVKHKYTESQVRHAYELVKSGDTYAEAAAQAGMSKEAIRAVCSGRKWRHLGLEKIELSKPERIRRQHKWHRNPGV